MEWPDWLKIVIFLALGIAAGGLWFLLEWTSSENWDDDEWR